MAVTIKSARELELMREAGKILAKVHVGLDPENADQGRQNIKLDKGELS